MKNHCQNSSIYLQLIFFFRLVIKKNIMKKKETIQKFEIKTMKKTDIGIAKKKFVGLDSFMLRRPIQKAKKCNNYV